LLIGGGAHADGDAPPGGLPAAALSAAGDYVGGGGGGDRAPSVFGEQGVDLVITELETPGGSGRGVAGNGKTAPPGTTRAPGAGVGGRGGYRRGKTARRRSRGDEAVRRRRDGRDHPSRAVRPPPVTFALNSPLRRTRDPLEARPRSDGSPPARAGAAVDRENTC